MDVNEHLQTLVDTLSKLETVSDVTFRYTEFKKIQRHALIHLNVTSVDSIRKLLNIFDTGSYSWKCMLRNSGNGVDNFYFQAEAEFDYKYSRDDLCREIDYKNCIAK